MTTFAGCSRHRKTSRVPHPSSFEGWDSTKSAVFGLWLIAELEYGDYDGGWQKPSCC